MNSSADPHLPAPAAPSPPEDPSDRNGEGRGRAVPIYRRRSRGRPLAWGLGASVVIHLLVLLFASRTWLPFRKPTRGGPPSDQSAVRTVREMEVVSIRITPEATSSEPEPLPPAPTERDRHIPRRTPSREEPATPASPGREGAPVPAAPRDRRTPGEILRPEYMDPRYWERPGAPERPKDDFDEVRERVYSRLEAINDSMALESEAARRSRDWTHTDKDGKRWGVSPGKVHLGGVTIPLPLDLSGPPDKAKEARERAGKNAEIDRQRDGARIRGTFEDQVRSTRARKDQERARRARRDSTRAGGTD